MSLGPSGAATTMGPTVPKAAFALQDVARALANPEKLHLAPFGRSCFTSALQDWLGGGAQVACVGCLGGGEAPEVRSATIGLLSDLQKVSHYPVAATESLQVSPMRHSSS
jgi:hypothetical protein